MISQPLRHGTGTQSRWVVHKVQKYGDKRVHVLAVDPLIFSKETRFTIAKHRQHQSMENGSSISQARYFTSTRFISQSSTKPQPFHLQCVIKYVRNAAIQSTISSWAYKQGASKRTRPLMTNTTSSAKRDIWYFEPKIGEWLRLENGWKRLLSSATFNRAASTS
jgi:hypothetical protein